MEYKVFEEMIEKIKNEQPILFELKHDEIPDIASVKKFEKENSIKLPEKYCKFLRDFGGGYFGFQNIYSLDKSSDFYIMKNQCGIPKNYLAIADNGCGDYYVLQIDNNVCFDPVFILEHETGDACEVDKDVLGFLVRNGLKK